MNSTTIDIIFVVFLLLMTIFGYTKGFIIRLYEFITSILVIFLSFWLSKPMSSILILYKYNESDIFTSIIGSFINQIVIFFVLLIVLFCIKKLIGIFIKPFLETLSEKFALTSFVDHLLGLALGFIEGIMIAYIAVAFLITPLYAPGQGLINETMITKHVLDVVPTLSKEFQNMNTNLTNVYDSQQSIESLTKLTLKAHEMGWLDDEQMSKIFKDCIFNKLEDEKMTLTLQQKQMVNEILVKSDYNQDIKKKILSNINVSDEQ